MAELKLFLYPPEQPAIIFTLLLLIFVKQTAVFNLGFIRYQIFIHYLLLRLYRDGGGVGGSEGFLP